MTYPNRHKPSSVQYSQIAKKETVYVNRLGGFEVGLAKGLDPTRLVVCK